MINIALSDLDVVGKPSRCTYAIAQWLEERHRNVYPQMDGYRANMATGLLGGSGPSFLDVRTPVKMPDALRGEKYAFVSLPLAEFKDGGGVNDDNIGVGKLCPIDPALPADGGLLPPGSRDGQAGGQRQEQGAAAGGGRLERLGADAGLVSR